MGIKHNKTSTIQTTGDPSLIGPADWNADHVAVGTVDLSTAMTVIAPTGGIQGVSPVTFVGAPTGSCTTLQSALDTTTGNFYTCVGGVWSKVGPGAATLSTPVVSPNPLAFDVDTHYKGPNPYTDVTRYGVRAVVANGTPAISGITATIGSGSSTATVSTSSCPSQTGNTCFINGDGVTIYGAGPTITMTTPSAPTITPSNATLGTGTSYVVAAPSGSTTFNYKVLACDVHGGCTAASPTGSTTTGNVLGAQSISVTSMSRSGSTVTFNTPSQPGFSIGTTVHVDNCSVSSDVTNGFCLGWFTVAGVSGTGFTAITSLSTANGASTAAVGTATANWWNSNHITFTGVSGALFYVLQSDRQNPGTFVNIVRSWPVSGSLINNTTTFDDFGQSMMSPSVNSIPKYVPTNGLATNENLTTTISSGAGTTALVLAVNASTSVSGATILLDNTPNLITANGAVSGPIEFPFTSGSYVFNSFVDLTNAHNPLMFAGGVVFNDTVKVGALASWYGDRIPSFGSALQFVPTSVPVIQFGTTPGLWISSGISGYFKWLQFQSSSNGVAVLCDDTVGGQLGIGYDFTVFVGQNDAMSMGLANRGCASHSGTVMFAAGNQSQTNVTFTPAAWWDGTGETSFDHVMGSARAMMVHGGGTGGAGGFRIGHYHWQGNAAPIITTDNSAAIGFTIGDSGPAIIDTGSHPAVFVSSIGNQKVSIFCGTSVFGCGQGSAGVLAIYGANAAISSVIGNTNGGTNMNLVSYSNFTDVSAQIAGAGSFGSIIFPQTLVSCNASAGGSVPTGAHNYSMQVIDAFGRFGPVGPNTPITISGGTQTVTCVPPSAPPGGVTWYLLRDGAVTAFSFGNGPVSFTTNGVDTAGFTSAAPTISTAYVSGITQQGLAAPQLQLTNNGNVSAWLGPIVFASLGSPSNGTFRYCSDCTIASPCAGSGTGALAKRLNGVWVCN